MGFDRDERITFIRRLPKAKLHLRPESNIGSGMLVELSTPTR